VIAVELRKLFRRPRTWVSVFLLCLLPAIVAIFLATSDIAPGPGEGPELLAAVLSNGTLYPAAALALVLPIFLPVAVSVVAGESVAGEAGAGTLRYLLVRPVGRSRLLLAKLVSVIAFDLLAVIAVALSAYLIGTALLGRAPTGDAPTLGATTLSGTPLSTASALQRTLLTLAYVAWSMLGVAAISLFLSTLANSPLGAALGALAALVLSEALVRLEAASALRPYLPTRYWLAWRDFFRDPILWHDVQRGIAVQGVYVVVFLGLAWANFLTKDVMS
jgi:ABC-2 type transport system permease protein